MKIVKKADGTINVNATLRTFELGDTMTLRETDVNVDYLRTQASKTARKNEWTIEIANSMELRGKVIIKRTK